MYTERKKPLKGDWKRKKETVGNKLENLKDSAVDKLIEIKDTIKEKVGFDSPKKDEIVAKQKKRRL